MAQLDHFSAGFGVRVALLGFVLTTSGVVAACGDEQSCEASSAQPAVYVIDSETHEPICDGEVEIRGSAYEETITYTGQGDCSGLYYLPAREDTYTTFVSSQSGDYNITATQITIRKGSCGIVGPENAGPQNGLPGQPNAVTVELVKF
ncbi:MAG: hypothetical protein KC766_21580 [Myxococcales bacterium]|nr:hypothetical protein [Myxococcales bacterium]